MISGLVKMKGIQMNYVAKLSILIGLVALSTGCSIRHVVSADYTQYLTNNEGSYQPPHTDYEAEYILTPNTANHNYEFRAATVGYAHLWVVNFGKILEKTLESKDVQSAFKKLSKADGKGTPGTLVISFNLVDYEFSGLEARVKLQITAIKDDSILFDRTYFEKGISQGGKMFFAGPFGMKNAIQQSTKSAIDKIMAQSLNDITSKTGR